MPADASMADASMADASIADASPLDTASFPIVAIGASAGGIEATTRLLEALPPDTGMAYVVIQHLSPEHESVLSKILGRATKMRVEEAKDGLPVEPNRVYVIPPNRMLTIADGALQLRARTQSPGRIRSVDEFMRSLAQTHGSKSIGVVLSGWGSDGTAGLEEIKAAGGITFAQDTTAGHEGMPSSAIAADAVDFVLPTDEIAHELARIAHHPFVVSEPAPKEVEREPEFQQILDVLLRTGGLDFSRYKRNMLRRRVTRRMVLHKVESLGDYLRLLHAKPEEAKALYEDVLIRVTSFFREPEAYEALKTIVFPRLTDARDPGDPIRVWSLGCSTGEEPYSIAMAYSEYCDASGRRVPLQIFASDINGANIEKARGAVYPGTIARDVSPERLRRFFQPVEGGYRIAKPIRDLCVFARHDALTDPPFSRIDLASCRNLLIYLEPALQQRIVPLLHYSLRDNGFLWLGSSETVGTFRGLFQLLDARTKIYARKGRRARRAIPLRGERAAAASSRAGTAVRRENTAVDALREAERMLLSRYAPPGVVVNEAHDVLQFRGDTGPFLAPAPGRTSLNLFKMLREGLLVAVRGALHRARRDRAIAREEGLRVRSNGGWREVDIVVMPVRATEVADAAYLVLFEEPAGRAESRAHEVAAEARAAISSIPAERDELSQKEISRLKHELSATRDYLQSVIEQQEAANEELQSANEEVQSANEELQSTNEELETSKEEIQSANEELTTVNEELQNRNLELSQTNNDVMNLLVSVNMPIVMLGADLRVRRVTERAERILGVTDADAGRALSEIRLGIEVPDLGSLVADTIRNATANEREVQDRNQRWYLLRVRPYRTFENKIDGAVILLVDIDNLKRAERSLRESEQRFEILADSAPALIWVNDLEGCRFVNRALEAYVGGTEAEIRKAGLAAYVHPEDRARYTQGQAAALRERRGFDARVRMRNVAGSYRWMKVIATPRFVDDGSFVGLVGSMIDVTDLAEGAPPLRGAGEPQPPE